MDIGPLFRVRGSSEKITNAVMTFFLFIIGSLNNKQLTYNLNICAKNHTCNIPLTEMGVSECKGESVTGGEITRT